MADRKILNVNQIISQLEEDDVFAAEIFITPPDNWQNSDEDSGDEEFASINNLSTHQLLAEAECRVTRSSQVESRIVNELVGDELEEDPIPSTSSVTQPAQSNSSSSVIQPPPPKRRRVEVTRKWRFVDIPEKAEKEYSEPDFLENLESPVQFFELFFDEEVFELPCLSICPGPVKDYDSPFDAFTDIFDRDIMEKIVLETYRYAKQTIDDLKDRGALKRSSRLNRWNDTNVEEMMVFFGVLMYMGIDPRASVTEYWITNVLEMPNFKSLMSYNRYVLLNKFLHFVDNSDGCQNRLQSEDMCSGDRAMYSRVWKLSPLLKHLQEKFGKNLGFFALIQRAVIVVPNNKDKGCEIWYQVI